MIANFSFSLKRVMKLTEVKILEKGVYLKLQDYNTCYTFVLRGGLIKIDYW